MNGTGSITFLLKKDLDIFHLKDEKENVNLVNLEESLL